MRSLDQGGSTSCTRMVASRRVSTNRLQTAASRLLLGDTCFPGTPCHGTLDSFADQIFAHFDAPSRGSDKTKVWRSATSR